MKSILLALIVLGIGFSVGFGMVAIKNVFHSKKDLSTFASLEKENKPVR